MADDIMTAYVAGLQQLLAPPPVSTRSGEAARPVSPYQAPEIEVAIRFLDQSAILEDALRQQWQGAATAYERSRAEVQLLAAAAADLAIAERLLEPELEGAVRSTKRSGAGGSEELIRQALQHPDQLLAPNLKVAGRRGADSAKKMLEEAAFKCLEDIEDRTFRASKDAIEGLLLMPLAALKEAAEMIGADIIAKLRESSVAVVQLAMNYILKASAKIRLLLGEQGEEQIRQSVTAFLEKLRDEKAIRQAIARWVGREDIFVEGKTWIAAYGGEETKLVAARDQIVLLQGSFAGRTKIADVVVKGLAVAKLALAVQAVAMPWAQLLVGAAYLGVVGFILFSALDHADSDRFRSFDRVHGVRGVLKTELAVG